MVYIITGYWKDLHIAEKLVGAEGEGMMRADGSDQYG